MTVPVARKRDLAVGGDDIDGGALQLGAFHLAGEGALPDQLVEPRLIAIEMARDLFRRAREAGGADRFVRFLRVLRLARIDARRARARSASP